MKSQKIVVGGNPHSVLINYSYRSIDALKNKYLNLKRNAKKKFAAKKRSLYRTGGGPSVKITESTLDVDMREILSCQMTGFDSQFDGDRTELLDGENITVVEGEDFDENAAHDITVPSTSKQESFLFDENSPPSSLQKDWSKQTVTNLRTPVSAKLVTMRSGNSRKRDNFLKTKLADWAKAKQDTVNTQQQCLIEEHQQKMDCIKEKHEAGMRQQQEKHDQNIRINEAEHKIKIDILKLQKQKLLDELSK